MNVDAVRINIGHVAERAAAVLTEIHDVAHIIRGGIDVRVYHRLLRLRDERRVGIIRRIVDEHNAAVRLRDAVDNARRSRDEIEIIFALEPLLDDLHVQKPQETAAEAEAQRHRGFRLEGEGGVVELKLLESVAQIRVLCAVRRINAAVHHGLHRAVARQRIGGGVVRPGDGVAHTGILHRLDGRREIAHLAGSQLARRFKTRGAHVAAFHHRELAAVAHHADRVARMDGALHETDVRHDAAIGIIIRIKDQRAQRGFVVSLWRRHKLHDLFHDGADVDPLLRGDGRGVVRRDADDVLDFLAHALRIGAGQVDFVDHGHDLKPGVHREIRVRQRLCLDALRGIHHEHGPLARRQTARNLIVEIDVAGRVDQVEHIILPVLRMVYKRDGVGLDGDAALTLEIHVVEQLVLHVAQGNGLRLLQNTVGQRALAVVDVRNDAEIPDFIFWIAQFARSS